MEDNVTERLENIRELGNMLDVVTNKNKDVIISGKKELVDIIKHSDLTFEVENNNEKIEFTKNIFEVITNKDGKIWHELYDDQGTLLLEVPDEEFQKGKLLTQSGQIDLEDKNLISEIYKRDNDKSLIELESTQSKEVANVLGMKEEDIKDLNILKFNEKTTTSDKANEAKKQLEKFRELGFPIDTSELATSEQTIKEFLNIDADKLLIIKINSEWKALKINDNGSMEIEDNLQITNSSKSFSTINADGNKEYITPTVEFRRKDNSDYSLAIDNSTEEKTQGYLVAGNSRTASEIETHNIKSPYIDTINNELLQEATENPDNEIIKAHDKDPHEPDEPDLVQGPNHY